MSNAMTALANLTLGANQTTVTFSNIPTSGYRDLRLVITTRSTRSADNQDAIFLQYNGDTGANYSAVQMSGSGSTTLSSTETQARVGRPEMSVSGNTNFGVTTVDIMDYSATDKHKTHLSRWNAQVSDYGVGAFAGRWASTAAITSFTLNLVQSGSQFASGSTFELFGIVS